MVKETEVAPFFEWLPGGLAGWLIIVLCVAGAGVLIGWLVVALRQGPVVAMQKLGRVLADCPADLILISPRRVFAMSWLAVKESIRRRVVVVFVVFVLILLFAGWFLDPGSDHPARLYLDFVLTATSYLVLGLALLLSAMSLPVDIKNKTLHTVVTKPVRRSEIVLGRMVGFTVVGSVLLAIMGLVSYAFVVRGLSHTHQLAGDDLQQGRTSRIQEHRHKVTLDASGNGHVQTAHEHWHDLSINQSAKRPVYRLGSPRGRLVARVPIYGRQLRFKDSDGRDAEKGVNVGDEWMYRSFIRGGSLAAAIWTFDGITEDNFPRSLPDGLPLEMTIEVFRTYKGKVDDPEDIPGILGSLAVRGATGEKVEVKLFKAKDFVTDVHYIPLKLETVDGRQLDLFKDLAPDGKLELWLTCLDSMQYFGVAKADVYFRARDASFAANFAKGYLGIWLQMISVIGIGVMFSTFLSGPIAILATVGAVVPKLFCPQLLNKLAAGEATGGGPLEALFRLVTQQNLVSPLEPGLKTTLIKMLDENVFQHGMRVGVAVLPEFGIFHFSNYVAYGFDIPMDLVLQCVLRSAAMLLPVFVAGYLYLKMREVAR